MVNKKKKKVYVAQSFQRNGNRITDSTITIQSRATKSNTVVVGMEDTSLKAAFESRISNNNCGMIRGNPKIAMIAAF